MSPIIKRRGEEFTLPSKYLLFILTIVCTALIVITFNTNLFTGPLNSFAGVFVVPFQKGITSVSKIFAQRLHVKTLNVGRQNRLPYPDLDNTPALVKHLMHKPDGTQPGVNFAQNMERAGILSFKIYRHNRQGGALYKFYYVLCPRDIFYHPLPAYRCAAFARLPGCDLASREKPQGMSL